MADQTPAPQKITKDSAPPLGAWLFHHGLQSWTHRAKLGEHSFVARGYTHYCEQATPPTVAPDSTCTPNEGEKPVLGNSDDSSRLPGAAVVMPTESDADAQSLFALLSPEAAAIYARIRKRDFEARRKLMESASYWEAEAEREYDQRQLEVGAQEYRGNTVSYMYDKAKCYGDMVHGCSVTLDEMGYPPDRFAKDGNVGAISRAIAAMGEELKTLRSPKK